MTLHDTNQDCIIITCNYHKFDMISCHRGPFGQGKTKPHMFIMTCLTYLPELPTMNFQPDISKTGLSSDLPFSHDVSMNIVPIQFKS